MIDNFPWMDGFDYYSTDRLTYKWAGANNIHVSPTAGRKNSGHITPTGAGAYLVSPDFKTGGIYYEPVSPFRERNESEFTIAFALRRCTTDEFKVIAQTAGNVDAMEFVFTPSGRIGYGLIGGEQFLIDPIIPMCEWCHVRLYIDFESQLYIGITSQDGNEIAEYSTIDDTFGAATEDWKDSFWTTELTSWKITGEAVGNWQIDDLYILGNKKFPKEVLPWGDCRIFACEPYYDDAPNCDYANWTATLPGDVDFSYAVSQRAESVTATGLPTEFAMFHTGYPELAEYVKALQANAWASQPGSDAAIQLAITSNAVTATAAPQIPGASELGYRWTWVYDPDGVEQPWTVDTANALTFGMEVIAND